MRLRKKKDGDETFVIPLGSGIKLDKSAQKIENQIWARMREISGLTNEQIDALSEGEFDKLYEKAVESRGWVTSHSPAGLNSANILVSNTSLVNLDKMWIRAPNRLEDWRMHRRSPGKGRRTTRAVSFHEVPMREVGSDCGLGRPLRPAEPYRSRKKDRHLRSFLRVVFPRRVSALPRFVNSLASLLGIIYLVYGWNLASGSCANLFHTFESDSGFSAHQVL